MTIDRLEFLKMAFMASAASTAAPSVLANALKNRSTLPPRNPMPYSGLDWSKCSQIHTTTHGHCTTDEKLKVYLKRGFGFFTMSNYYPAAPYYPAREMIKNKYRAGQDHAIMFNGKRKEGPFDWNEIISAWKDELPEELKKTLPFKAAGKMFPSFPKDMLEAPNAEHSSLKGAKTQNVHICSPGSMFASGMFDAHNKYLFRKHGYSPAASEPWKVIFDRIMAGLLYPDGGGITINHPAWSQLDKDFLVEMLDYDPRVLGIEVFNYSAGRKNPKRPWSRSWSEEWWDYALCAGRQCFGFSVPDWGYTRGVNILLVPEKTAHACLKAYREGNFYGAVIGHGALTFTGIAFNGKKLTASTDKAARFEVISKQGVVYKTQGTECAFDLPKGDHVYLRLKAYATDNSGEILFAQPFMIGA
jgi:hypothetical protein